MLFFVFKDAWKKLVGLKSSILWNLWKHDRRESGFWKVLYIVLKYGRLSFYFIYVCEIHARMWII